MSPSKARVRSTRMSKWNVISAAVIAVLIVAAAVRQVWPVVGLLSIALVVGIIVPLAAHIGPTGDFERVSAMEPQDERDRLIAIKGLAVVGGVSLVAPFLFLTVWAIADYTAFYDNALTMPIVFYYLLLTAVWSVSNWYFARH